MKNLKYLFLTLLGALAFVACTEDEREADWSAVKGNGVYFAMDAQTSFTLEENQSSLYVPVMRTFSQGALEVNVQFSDAEKTGIFAADSKARFADGSLEGRVEVVIDFSKVQFGKDYVLTLLILDDDQKSGYGADNLTFTVKYDPWTYVGKGYYRDGIIDALFNILTPFAQTECDVYQADYDENLYRLANVYNNPFFCGPMFGYDPAQVPASYTQEGYITFNVANPNKVYILQSSIGLNVNPEYGWFEIGSICPENGFDDYDFYGKLENGIITFPAGGLFFHLPLYNGGYTAQANLDGMTRIVMPGGVALDPSVSILYDGVLVDPDSNASAIFNITLNEDAAKVLFYAADASDDYGPIISGMKDGSIACEEITENGKFTYLIDNPGQYMGIFIPVSADGTVFGSAMGVPFEYSTGGILPSQFTAEFTIQADETVASVAVTPNTDKFEYYWDFMTKKDYDAAVAEFGSIEEFAFAFFEYVAQSNGVSMGAVMQAYASKGEVAPQLIEGLKVGTEYVAYAFCVNMNTGAARSEASVYEFSTLESQPLDPAYENMLGTWTVTSTSSEIAMAPMTFEMTFEQKKSNVMYSVYGFTGNQSVAKYPVEGYFQAADAENVALFYIVEQFTNTRLNTDYGITQLALLGRTYVAQQQEYTWVGVEGAPCLVGAPNSATSATMQPWEVTVEGEDGSSQKVTYSGADFTLFILEGSYKGYVLTISEDVPVGPFTMEKKASTQSVQPKGQFSTGMSVIRQSNLVKVDGKLARRAFLAKNNSVMVR